MVGTHPAATGWVPRGSGPEDLEQTDQDPGDGCERANDLAPRRGPALSWAPGSRVARRTLAHSPLTSFRWIDTPSNKREVSGVIRLKEGLPIIARGRGARGLRGSGAGRDVVSTDECLRRGPTL